MMALRTPVFVPSFDFLGLCLTLFWSSPDTTFMLLLLLAICIFVDLLLAIVACHVAVVTSTTTTVGFALLNQLGDLSL